MLSACACYRVAIPDHLLERAAEGGAVLRLGAGEEVVEPVPGVLAQERGVAALELIEEVAEPASATEEEEIELAVSPGSRPVHGRGSAICRF